MNLTTLDGLDLYHEVELGPGVAVGVAKFISTYAARAGVRSLPPITLEGEFWSRPWEEVVRWHGWYGETGPPYDAEKAGVNYRVFWLRQNEKLHPSLLEDPEHAKDLEGVIAHEMTHHRW